MPGFKKALVPGKPSLVLSNNLMQLYIAWELVGLCSYFLIGFYGIVDKGFPSIDFAKKACVKAFMVNRVGDFGFFIGIMIVFSVTNQLGFFETMDLSGFPPECRFLCFRLGLIGRAPMPDIVRDRSPEEARLKDEARAWLGG